MRSSIIRCLSEIAALIIYASVGTNNIIMQHLRWQPMQHESLDNQTNPSLPCEQTQSNVVLGNLSVILGSLGKLGNLGNVESLLTT